MVYRVSSRQCLGKDPEFRILEFIVSVKDRRSYPMVMTSCAGCPVIRAGKPVSEPRPDTQASATSRKPGRPKGSRNRKKTQVVLSATLRQLQTMLKALLTRIGDLITWCLMGILDITTPYRWHANV